jgi:hypothetical protein
MRSAVLKGCCFLTGYHCFAGWTCEKPRDSLDSINVGLKPCLILDDLKIAPRKFAEKRFQVFDGSVLR